MGSASDHQLLLPITHTPSYTELPRGCYSTSDSSTNTPDTQASHQHSCTHPAQPLPEQNFCAHLPPPLFQMLHPLAPHSLPITPSSSSSLPHPSLAPHNPAPATLPCPLAHTPPAQHTSLAQEPISFTSAATPAHAPSHARVGPLHVLPTSSPQQQLLQHEQCQTQQQHHRYDHYPTHIITSGGRPAPGWLPEAPPPLDPPAALAPFCAPPLPPAALDAPPPPPPAPDAGDAPVAHTSHVASVVLGHAEPPMLCTAPGGGDGGAAAAAAAAAGQSRVMYFTGRLYAFKCWLSYIYLSCVTHSRRTGRQGIKAGHGRQGIKAGWWGCCCCCCCCRIDHTPYTCYPQVGQ